MPGPPMGAAPPLDVAPVAMDPEMGGGETAEGEFPDMPRADTDGDSLCPCPDEEEEIEGLKSSSFYKLQNKEKEIEK